MAAIFDFCTKMKNSDFWALNDLLDQSKSNQTWWEWQARYVVHIFSWCQSCISVPKWKFLLFASKLHQSQPNQTNIATNIRSDILTDILTDISTDITTDITNDILTDSTTDIAADIVTGILTNLQLILQKKNQLIF